MCSIDTGAPERGKPPEVDPTTFIQMEARAMSFPVRLPQTPEGWATNSVRRTMVGGQPAPVIGYVTAESGYIQFTQTGQSTDAAVDGYDENWRERADSYSLGERSVVVYRSPEKDVRELRVVDLDEARVLLSGAATSDEFNTLIESAMAAQPLPKN